MFACICALAATIHEICNRNCFASTERPQIIVGMSAPTSGIVGTGKRSGPRSLGDESGPDITTTPTSYIINSSRPRAASGPALVRRRKRECPLLALSGHRLVRCTCLFLTKADIGCRAPAVRVTRHGSTQKPAIRLSPLPRAATLCRAASSVWIVGVRIK